MTTATARSIARTKAAIQPPVEAVMGYGARRVETAAQGLWPKATVRLGDRVPSVTSYVQHLTVDGHPHVGKVSFLGVPIAEILRGAHGAWPAVVAAQREYESAGSGLLERQAVQYGLLRNAGLCAPRPAMRHGAQITPKTTGQTLDDLLLRHPGRAGDLLTAVVNELAALNDLPEAKPLIREAGSPEYRVTNAFARAFPRDSVEGAPAPLGDLGEVVGRLRPLVAEHTPVGDDVVVYGDLAPEHIVVTGSAGRPLFLDPALSIGPVVLDVARLVSRLALQVMAVRHRHARRIFASVHQGAVLLARRHEHPTDWLRSLALLWAADTATYLHTCRTAPMVLPQPYQAEAVLSIEPAVLAMLDRSVRALDAVSDGTKVWHLLLDSAARAAGQ